MEVCKRTLKFPEKFPNDSRNRSHFGFTPDLGHKTYIVTFRDLLKYTNRVLYKSQTQRDEPAARGKEARRR